MLQRFSAKGANPPWADSAPAGSMMGQVRKEGMCNFKTALSQTLQRYLTTSSWFPFPLSTVSNHLCALIFSLLYSFIQVKHPQKMLSFRLMFTVVKSTGFKNSVSGLSCSLLLSSPETYTSQIRFLCFRCSCKMEKYHCLIEQHRHRTCTTGLFSSLSSKPLNPLVVSCLVHLLSEHSRACDTADFFLGISSLVASFTPYSPDSPTTPLMVLCLFHYSPSSHSLKCSNIMTFAPLSSYFTIYLNNLTFEILTL